MSVHSDLLETLGPIKEVEWWSTDKTTYHGEKAVEVTVTLRNGKTVTGTFTVEDKTGFGGVQFAMRKDPAALMASKVRAVLNGTADN